MAHASFEEGCEGRNAEARVNLNGLFLNKDLLYTYFMTDDRMYFMT